MTPLRQLAHLVGLRWSMTSPAARVGSCVALAVVVAGARPVLALAAAGTTDRLPQEVRNQSTELLAGAYLLLVVGLVTAAVASAAVARSCRAGSWSRSRCAPRTEHLGALLLAPLNLAWLIQVLGLTLITGAGAGGVTAASVEGAVLPDGSLSPSATGAVLLAVAVAWSWAFVATAAAQVLAWAVEIVRTLPAGRWWLRGAMAVAALWALLVVDQALLVTVLDRTPTALVSDRALEAVRGDLVGALVTVGVLVVAGVLLVLLGGAVHSALSRRPSRDQARQETQRHRPHDLPARTRRPRRSGRGAARTGRACGGRRRCAAGWWCSSSRRWPAGCSPGSAGPTSCSSRRSSRPAPVCCSGSTRSAWTVGGAVAREPARPARTWLLSRGWVLTEVVLLTAVAATWPPPRRRRAAPRRVR